MQFNFRFEFYSYLKGTQCTNRCPIKGGKLCASQSLPGTSWSDTSAASFFASCHFRLFLVSALKLKRTKIKKICLWDTKDVRLRTTDKLVFIQLPWKFSWQKEYRYNASIRSLCSSFRGQTITEIEREWRALSQRKLFLSSASSSVRKVLCNSLFTQNILFQT